MLLGCTLVSSLAVWTRWIRGHSEKGKSPGVELAASHYRETEERGQALAPGDGKLRRSTGRDDHNKLTKNRNRFDDEAKLIES